MDWNNDGKVDWQDYALHQSATSNNGGGDSYVGDTGCLSWILLGLFILYILDILIRIFS